MILCGVSTPQRARLVGSDFPTDALVLLTPPHAGSQLQIAPVSVSATEILFDFVFATCGDYIAYVVSAASLCSADLSSGFPFTLSTQPPTELPPLTLGDLRTQTQHRLGDDAGAIWPTDEVTRYVLEGYRYVATALHTFFDILFAENLPRGFSVTQPWELEYAHRLSGGFDDGVGNFTAEFERNAGQSLGWRETDRFGPANYTSPFEATDGLLARAHASTAIPATSELPKTLTALDRVSWDKRAIEAIQPRSWSTYDSRYEITAGEVYAYMWQKDGVRTLRKVRVPAQIADTVTVNGNWGAMRSPTDLSTESVTGTWGVPRRIAGHHPSGPDLFGAPRRPFLEGKNVRVECYRQGRVLVDEHQVCELPRRYALALRDYAQARCLERPGPGFDAELAAHFDSRWQRVVARLRRRLQLVDTEHVPVMGGDGQPSIVRPPRPKLPWAYGSRVR